MPQLIRYLISGGTAAGLQISSNQLLLWSGMWFFTAAKISGGIGLVAAFIGHKFFAFKKKQQTGKQVFRFAILQICNYFLQLVMVYFFVTKLHVHPSIANILGIGITVSWNFVIYKLFVYV